LTAKILGAFGNGLGQPFGNSVLLSFPVVLEAGLLLSLKLHTFNFSGSFARDCECQRVY
jgi:hypothetical protein